MIRIIFEYIKLHNETIFKWTYSLKLEYVQFTYKL